MKRKLTILILPILLAASCGLGTAAYYVAEGFAVNEAAAGRVDISIRERQGEAELVMPGQRIGQTLWVENLAGSAPAYIRAKLELAGDGPSAPPVALSGGSAKWSMEGDYWYYSEPVAAGAHTEPLFREITCDPAATNEHQNTRFRVGVVAEAIQSEHTSSDPKAAFAALASPGTASEATTLAPSTSVLYEAASRRIAFNGASGTYDTDLLDFTGLLPGKTLRRETVISCTGPATLYMQALPTNARFAPYESVQGFLELMDVTVAIQETGRILFSGKANQEGGLDNPALVGNLATGQNVTLITTLSLSPKAGNEYQDAKGKLVWRFVVEEREPGPGWEDDPWPGDPTLPARRISTLIYTGGGPTSLGWGLLTGSAAFLVMLLLRQRKWA